MLTWTKEDGTWGLKNFDIKKLPGEVYGAVCKLHDYEKSGLSPEMAARAKEILDFFGSEDEVWRCKVKLQEYEHTGLTPGQITEMDALFAEKCREVARISDIENANERKWIPCSERMPENGKEVEITYTWESYVEKGKTCYGTATAFYTDGTMTTEESGYCWEDAEDWEYWEYCEEEDVTYIPEGWWEHAVFSETFSAVDDNEYKVIAWRPCPEPYRPGQKTVGEDYKRQIMGRFLRQD